MARYLCRLAPAVALVVLAGCGNTGYPPVSGRVTLNGQPLAGARVAFQPVNPDKFEGGFGSVGTTDADGRYTLRVIGEGRAGGALVGPHHVVVSKSDRPDAGRDERPGPAAKELVPAKYNARSGLTFDVPAGGTSDANFDLTP